MRIIKRKSNQKTYDSDKNLSFWDQVDEQTHYLMADKLNQVLPLANCRDKKIFNLSDDADYRTLCAEVENDYGDDLPDKDQAVEEIAYEYLFLVIKSLLGKLRGFNCHQEIYLTKLTN